MGSAIWLLAQHPDQYELLRNDLSLATGALNETLRLETPIRGFARHTARATTFAGVDLPAGARVLVLYASANRDERKWDQPEVFDITRRNADHLGFGLGSHSCAGQGLARIEVTSVLASLARHALSLQLCSAERSINNVIRSFSSIVVTTS